MPWLIALLTILVAPIAAQDGAPVELRPSLAPGPLTVGDWLEYTLHVPLADGERVAAPGEEADFGAWEVRDYHEELQPDGAKLTYQLALFETGTVEIPSIEIEIADAAGATRVVKTASTDAVVESVLEEGDEAPADIVGPLSLREDPLAIALRVLLVVVVVGAIALLIWWLWKRKKARVVERAARPDPPDVAALKALEALNEQGLPEAGEIKPYYSELSEIVRTYIWARFAVRTLEETTFRIVAGLRAHPHAAPHSQQFADILRESDLVKFAKARPSIGACRSALDAAEAFVRETSASVRTEETADALR